MTPTARKLAPILVLLSLAMGCPFAHAQTDPTRGPAAPVDSITGFLAQLDAESQGDRITDGGEAVTDAAPEAALSPTPPTIEVPALTPVGEPIVATLHFAKPDGSRDKITWEPFEFGTFDLGDNRLGIWAKAGKYTIGARVVLVTADEIYDWNPSATFTVGDPPPPKPLAELAGPHKQALADWYFSQIDAAAYIKTPDEFNAAHAGKLAALGLTDSEYATEAAKLFAKIGEGDWPLPLIGALKGIVKELGAPTPKPDPTPGPIQPGTAATYVYEKDDTAIPSEVQAAINKLNRERKILATIFEEDTVDGDGEVPDQYAVALAAARQAGLPAFVVTAGSEVLKVVRDPRTEAQVFEAIAL